MKVNKHFVRFVYLTVEQSPTLNFYDRLVYGGLVTGSVFGTARPVVWLARYLSVSERTVRKALGRLAAHGLAIEYGGKWKAEKPGPRWQYRLPDARLVALPVEPDKYLAAHAGAELVKTFDTVEYHRFFPHGGKLGWAGQCKGFTLYIRNPHSPLEQSENALLWLLQSYGKSGRRFLKYPLSYYAKVLGLGTERTVKAALRKLANETWKGSRIVTSKAGESAKVEVIHQGCGVPFIKLSGRHVELCLTNPNELPSQVLAWWRDTGTPKTPDPQPAPVAAPTPPQPIESKQRASSPDYWDAANGVMISASIEISRRLQLHAKAIVAGMSAEEFFAAALSANELLATDESESARAKAVSKAIESTVEKYHASRNGQLTATA